VLVKEFVQLRRDRVTFATMIFIPVMQLLLFGFRHQHDAARAADRRAGARGQRS
jgi:hypothetical protein